MKSFGESKWTCDSRDGWTLKIDSFSLVGESDCGLFCFEVTGLLITGLAS